MEVVGSGGGEEIRTVLRGEDQPAVAVDVGWGEEGMCEGVVGLDVVVAEGGGVGVQEEAEGGGGEGEGVVGCRGEMGEDF